MAPVRRLMGLTTEWMMSRPSGVVSRSLKALAAAASIRAPGAPRGRARKTCAHPPPPAQVQPRELVGSEEHLNPGTLRLAERREDLGGRGDGARDDVQHTG